MKSFAQTSPASRPYARGNISLHSLALTLVLMAVAVPVTFVFIVKGKKWVTNWWAGQRAQSVTGLIETGEAQTAAGVLSQALAANPNDPKLLRMWDDLLKQVKAPASDRVATLRKLLDNPDATDEDRLRLAGAHAQAGDWNAARRTLDALPPVMRRKSAALTIEAGILQATGRVEEAKSIFRRASAADPADIEARRVVAVIDLQEPFEEVRARARQSLFEIAGRKDISGTRAMLNLAQCTSLDVADARRLRGLADAREGITPSERLAVLKGVVKADPLEAGEIIARETRVMPGDVERRTGVFRWLIDLDRAEMVTRLIQPGHARSESGLFLVLAEALGRLGRWDELHEMLEKHVPPTFPKSHLALLRADCQLRGGHAGDGMRRLRLALGGAVAANDHNTIRQVAGMAEAHQLWDISVQCISWLAEAAKENKLLYLDALYLRLQKTGDTAHMLAAVKEMVAVMPGNADFVRRLSYLRLLSGQEMEMVDHCGAAPAELAALDMLIEAMSAYRLGQADRITSPLSRISQWNDLTPGQRAIAAGLLRHAGQEIEALRVWEKVSAAEMLPEEKRFADRVVAGTL